MSTIGQSSVVIVEETQEVIEVRGFIGLGPQGPKGDPGRRRVATQVWAANLTIDFGAADLVRVTLSGDTVISMSGAADGQGCILELTQDSAGNHGVAFDGTIGFSDDITSYVPTARPSARDRLGLIFDEASGKYALVAIAQGF